MKIVIAGAGFGGLKLARKLNNKKGFDITLIDHFNYHQFQPLFYQVATAGLDASNISFPLRKVFHNSKNVRIRMATMQKICPAEHKIITDVEEFVYDKLVIALGAGTNFFGNKDLEENAFPMKSTVEALQIRHRFIQNFEDALVAQSEDELESLLTVVVVGGGPTGVELSGALAEMKNYVLPKDYPELDFSKMKIFLVEGSARTLAAMSERSSMQSKQYLEKRGVVVMTHTIVKDYDGKKVLLSNGDTIHTSTVIWAAGIRGNVPVGIEENLIARRNRIKVDSFNRVEGHNDVFAIGDIAYMETEDYPHAHPQVAPVAIQQAALLARNLQKPVEKWTKFAYYDKGTLATVGRNLAVVDIPIRKATGTEIHFGGFIAWFIWMALHLMLILGVKNRFFVFCNWVYNYITYDQSLRLIFREFYKARTK